MFLGLVFSISLLCLKKLEKLSRELGVNVYERDDTIEFAMGTYLFPALSGKPSPFRVREEVG